MLRRLRKESAIPWITPAIFTLIVVAIIPTIFLFYLSLHNWELGNPWNSRTFIGLKNFVDVFKDEQFINSLLVTFKYCIAVVIIEFLLGFSIANYMKGQNQRIKFFILISLIIPLTMTPSVVGLIWRSYFNSTAGIINFFVDIIFGTKINWFSKNNALLTTILVDSWQWTSFVTIMLYSGLEALPQECFEAASMDGASGWEKIKYITLPLLKPIILIALLLRIMDAFKMFDVIFVMTEGGPGNATELLSLHIYRIGFFHTGYIGRASAIAVILLVIIIVFSQILIRKMSSNEK